MSYFTEVKIVDKITGTAATVNDSGQLHVVERGKIDPNNTTTTPLGIAGVFTGTATDILDYSALCILAGSDVAGELMVQYSPDGTTWYDGETYDIEAGATKFFTPPIQSAYYRVVYTNGGVAQTSFFIHPLLKKQAIKWSSHNIEDPITGQDDAQLTKAVITGKKASGDYDNVSLTNGGNMKISLEEFESGVSSNSNSQLNVTPFHTDGTEGALITGIDYASGKSGIDASTETLQTIDYEHHKIHSGSEYRAGFQKDIPNGGTAAFAITTPNTTSWLHFKLAVDIELEAQIGLYENPDSVTGGTAVTPRNANRNSANTSGATCVSDPTYTIGSAILLGMVVVGSGKSIGGESASANEWILKQNTTYLIVVTNQATGATNECNIKCRWYEHANKN